MDLKKIPLADLMAEIERRASEQTPDAELDPQTIRFCDDCIHFQYGDLKNNCTKNQRMDFRVPDSPIDDYWGFYKTDCRHFAERLDKDSCERTGHQYDSFDYCGTKIVQQICRKCAHQQYMRREKGLLKPFDPANQTKPQLMK